MVSQGGQCRVDGEKVYECMWNEEWRQVRALQQENGAYRYSQSESNTVYFDYIYIYINVLLYMAFQFVL